MATEPMSPLSPCRDAGQVQIRVVKFHGPEFQTRHGQMQFSVAVQLQTGKAGPQKKTALVPAQRVESWMEATWDARLAFDGVSWLAEEKTLPLLRFKVYGHRRLDSSSGGGKKSAALWSASTSCAPFFRFPNQAATIMLERQGSSSDPATAAFDASSLQVEIRVVPPTGSSSAPPAALLAPGSASAAVASGSVPINFQRDCLFVAVKGVKKLQHDVSADHSMQAQAELRVGSDGPFEVSKIVSLKRGSRSAAVQGTFMLPYHQSARLFTPVLTVNVNIFVGSSQNNVTMGSFCVNVPVFTFLLNGRHAVADWFPLHRHNSNTGNVKGYVFLELQHCFHASFQQPQKEGIYFRVLEATQLNMGPDLGQSSLHVEALGSGTGSAVDSVVARTESRRKRGGAVAWNEILFVPVLHLSQCSSSLVSLRLCNSNRYDDVDCHVGVASVDVDVARFRAAAEDAAAAGGGGGSLALGRELLDLVILDSADNSRGTLRCELLGLAGHMGSLAEAQLPDEPDTVAAQYSGFDGALHLRVHGVRYLDRFLKHAQLVVSPHEANSATTSEVASSPMARRRSSSHRRGGSSGGVAASGSRAAAQGPSRLQVKAAPLRRGSFVMVPVHSQRLPTIVRVEIVENQDGGGDGGDGGHGFSDRVAVRELHLPVQWFTSGGGGVVAVAGAGGGATGPDWFSLSPAQPGATVPPVGWGQLQLSGTWIPSAAGSLTIKVLHATGLPQRGVVDDEDVFVRFDVGKRAFKTSLAPQAGGNAQWNEAQRLQYSLWKDSFTCDFTLLRDTNLRDNFLGTRSLPVHVLLGMGAGSRAGAAGQTIYGEHRLQLRPSDGAMRAAGGSLLDESEFALARTGGAGGGGGAGSGDGPVLQIQSTFVPAATAPDGFADERQAMAAETLALKRLFYHLDGGAGSGAQERAFVVNRAQLCDAAAAVGPLTLTPARLARLARRDKMVTWAEWADFLTGPAADAAGGGGASPGNGRHAGAGGESKEELALAGRAGGALVPSGGGSSSAASSSAAASQQQARVFASLASDPALAKSNNRLVNILATELQRLRQELDAKDRRIQELESGGGARAGGGGAGVQASRFDFVRAGANNLRHLKAQRQSGGSATGRSSGSRASRAGGGSGSGKKKKKKSSEAGSAESDVVRRLQKKNEQLKTQLHLEKTRSLATDAGMVDHRINTDSAHMVKLLQHDHRLQVQSLEATNAELKRKLDRREQKYQRVLATQRMMEQKVLQKQRKVQSLERELEMLRVQLQGSSYRAALSAAGDGLDASAAALMGASADLERTVQARLDDQARRKKRSKEDEARAAAAIQGRYRGHRAKQEQQRHASATKIQANFRRHRYQKAGHLGGFEVGTRVLANCAGKAMRFGTITAAGGGLGNTKNQKDLYTVQYDHGPLERNVPGKWIKAVGEAEDPRAAELRAAQQAHDDATGGGEDFGTGDDFVGGADAAAWAPEVGDHVEFAKEYAADGSVVATGPPDAGGAVGVGEVVRKDAANDALELELVVADGEEGDVLPADKRTARLATRDARPHVRRYVEGDRVLVRYQGHTQWFEGVVTQECGGARYNVLYDDGNREFGAAAVFMKPAPRREEVDLRTVLAVGLVVEARYGGGPDWYRGKVQLVKGARGEEQCDIKYDDGDVEEDVPLVLIRLARDGEDGVAGPDGPGGEGDSAQDRDNDSLLKRLFQGLTDDEIKALLKTPWNSPKEKREVLKTIAMLPLKQKKAVCRLFMSEDSESRANRLEYVREFVRQQSELRRRERAARKIQKGVRTRRTSRIASRASEDARREAAALIVQRNYRRARSYKKCSYRQTKDSALKIQRYYRAKARRLARGGGQGGAAAAAAEEEPGKSEAELTAELVDALRSRAGVDTCEAIVMANADVHATGLGDDGVTPLYVAVEAAAEVTRGDESAEGVAALTVVSMLLKFKASPNVCTAGGAAPLHVAAALGSDDAVKVLLRDAAADAGVAANVAAAAFQHRNAGTVASVGCDVNLKDAKSGRTPLAVAAEAQHDAVVRILLDAGGVIDESTPAFQAGDTVEARYQGAEHYFPGRVQTAYIDNTFDVVYDDGDAEQRVPSALMRSYTPSDNEDDTFLVGDAVLANYRGDGQWYRGVVRKVNVGGGADDTEPTGGDMTNYDIEFSDGTIQKHVAADCVKEAPTAEGGVVYAVGDLVSVLYRQGTTYFDGVIGDTHDDGTYLVEYEDGDVEDYVRAKYIKLRVSQNLYYILGEKVEVSQVGADPASPSAWLPATVADTHDENRYYTVLYDGGDRLDIQIPGTRLRRGVAPALKLRAALRVDDQVEANFNSEGSWYPGRIVCVHEVEGGGRGGVPELEYDIAYDDGDAEDRKPAAEVRAIPRYKMGQKVEARYRGGNDWFPATIVGVTKNNKYHLEFEDGAGEQDILYSAIREEAKFKVGDKIQAQFRGLVEYFDGVVAEVDTQAHQYTVHYTDGDVETGVLEGLIRRRPEQEGFMPSEDVQVRLIHNKQKKWVAGKVIRAHGRDDYYVRAIMPDDDSRKIVLATIDDLRYPLDRDFVFEVGQRVEARFQLGMIYFAGSIAKQNDDDGTYDVAYDDGDAESRVAPEFIRRLRVNDFDGVFWHRVDDIFAAMDRGGDGRVTGADFAQYCSRLGDLDGPDDAGVGADTRRYWARFQEQQPGGGGGSTDQDGFRKFFQTVAGGGGGSTEAPEHSARCQAVCRFLSQGVHMDEKAQRELMPGSRVEARYGGFHEWFPGRIVARAASANTFHVQYDDGDHEQDVPANLIRFYESSDDEESSGDDDDVDDDDAEYESGSEEGGDDARRAQQQRPPPQQAAGGGSRTASSRRVRALFHAIDVSLGEKDGVLTWAELKASVDDKDVSMILLASLDKFLAAAGGGGKGQLDAAEWDRFFDHVAREDVRKAGGDPDAEGSMVLAASPAATQLLDLLETYVGTKGRGSADGVAGTDRFAAGQAVEARFGGEAEWFPGVIARVDRAAGAHRYDVRYDDGDFERDVDAALIRAPSLQPGDRVEGNFAAAGEWFPGKVERANEDGTYDIGYDDGDFEASVAREHVRTAAADDAESLTQTSGGGGSPGASRPGSPGGRAGGVVYGVGEHVEGNFGGQGSWFPGKISVANRDGTYDIVYDDGDAERGVRAALIRNPETFDGDSQSTMSRPAAGGGGEFQVGEQVEANFASQGSFFPGRVARVAGQGLYDIRYDDGDAEQDVPAALIRRVGGGHGGSSAGGFDQDSQSTAAAAARGGGGAEVFQAGDKVEANYAEQGSWFSGQVSVANRDGTYDIAYDDGDTEQDVPARLVRAAASAAASPPPGDAGGGSAASSAFAVGDRIEADFGGEGSYFAGNIARRNADGTYDIAYDDGDTENSVAPARVRKLDDDDSGDDDDDDDGSGDDDDGDVQGGFQVGDKVEADFAGAGSFFPGQVSKVNGDGTFDILYDDGDAEQGVDAPRIRRRGGEGRGDSSAATRAPPPQGGGGGGFRAGDRVEADYGGEGTYFPGQISNANANGTYDLRYDDGDEENAVPADRIVRVADGGGGGGGGETRLRPGDAVEADYAGEGSYFPGVVRTANADGTYDIDYDDGDAEGAVPAERVRKVASLDDGGDDATSSAGGGGGGFDADSQSTGAAAGKEFNVGDRIEADFAGEGSYFPGKVAAKQAAGGTYDVVYDDGDAEKGVPAARIRRLPVGDNDAGGGGGGGGDDDASDFDAPSKPATSAAARGASSNGKFAQGDKVEADFGGEGSFYPGSIAAAHGNGTYDVHYDDGDSEQRVPEARIRAAGADAAAADFQVGDLVEADFGGEGTYYPGKIERGNGDGTFAVRYDDGDGEDAVEAGLIRRRGEGDDDASSAGGGGSDGGGQKNKDAVNDFDNVSMESEAIPEDSKPAAAAAAAAAAGVGSSSGDCKFKRGDDVEADYHGEGEYFPGSVDRVNGDGTYDIAYDDGDAENSVPESRVREKQAAGGSGGGDDGKFKVGDSVEALYNGGDDWYGGKITADNGDGTYAITYDDGDKEPDVPEEEIRTRAAGGSGDGGGSGGGGKFQVGDSVEALYDGGDDWYGGKITVDNGDGTYAITYDDGDKEPDVPEEEIRTRAAGGGGGGGGGGASSGGDEASVMEGDEVQAYDFDADEMKAAEVLAENGDGTYHVKFLHDGHEDKAVERSDIELP